MMHTPELPGAFKGEGDVLAPSTPAVSAGRLYEQVPDELSERVRRIDGDGHADGVVVGAGQDGGVVAVVAQTGIPWLRLGPPAVWPCE